MGLAADQHLVFVGLMGTGKTTVAGLAAARLGRPLVDSDALVEARTGRTVREIWATDGEPAFRALETAALRVALDSDQPSVIAAAGGVVLDAANRALLKAARATVVWLCAAPDVLVQRVATGGHRPLLDDDPTGALARMAVERDDLYRQVADVCVSTDARTPAEVLEAVLR